MNSARCWLVILRSLPILMLRSWPVRRLSVPVAGSWFAGWMGHEADHLLSWSRSVIVFVFVYVCVSAPLRADARVDVDVDNP